MSRTQEINAQTFTYSRELFFYLQKLAYRILYRITLYIANRILVCTYICVKRGVSHFSYKTALGNGKIKCSM